MLEELKRPEYVHVLLNPLPVYGLAMGVVALILALIVGEKRAHTIALVLIAVASLSAWPVSESGEAGYDRVKAMSPHEGELWLSEHAERATAGMWAFYVTAALAVAGIACHWIAPRFAAKLSVLALLGALVALGVGGWISRAGGRVRHSEFRDGPPPAVNSVH